LLMPEDSLNSQWKKTQAQEVHARINEVAKHFKVSSQAAYYRLKNLGRLDNLGDIDEDLLKWSSDEDMPLLYSRYFVDMLHEVLERGLVSVRKAASLLNITVDDIDDLFRDYGLQPLYET
jgi:Zn-dependent peptidase ImmA (M78 family)